MRRLSLTLLLILFPISGFAQIPLAVSGNSEGSVARQLIYQIEREIEDHGDYSLVDSEGTHLMTLEIRAMPYVEGSDKATVYSLTWTVPNSNTEAGIDVFFASTVGYCGYDRVEGAARELVRQTDRYVSRLAEAMETEDDLWDVRDPVSENLRKWGLEHARPYGYTYARTEARDLTANPDSLNALEIVLQQRGWLRDEIDDLLWCSDCAEGELST